MSLVKLECPICEFVLEADLNVTAQARCTCCGHLFAPGKSNVRANTASRASESHHTPSTTPWKNNAPREKEDSPAMVSRADQIRSSIMLDRAKAQRRSQLILFLLFVGTLVAGVLVARQLGNRDDQDDQQIANSNPAVTDLSAIPTVTKVEAEAELSDARPQSPPPRAIEDTQKPPSAPPLDPPKFAYLSPSVAKDQAAQLKPYMMLLEIESPAGTTYATGTIVDSRGYLLTSLPAVAGATKIKVSSARSSSQIKNQTAPPMSDNVANVVALSNAQQWVLLEVNRRFVLNAADIRIPVTDRIVSKQPLLRVVAPRFSGDHAVSEFRVDRRRPSSALTVQQKELLRVSESVESSDITEDVNWLIGACSDYDQRGAALVSTKGALVGMLVNFDQEFAYYITTTAVGNLLQGNNFDKQPLSVLK